MNQFQEIEKLIQNDFSKTEEQLRKLVIDPVGEDVLRRVFVQIFSDTSLQEIREKWWTIYRLYSEINWIKMRGLPSDFVVDTCFGKQLVMACILNFEPIDETLWYLGLRFHDKTDAIVEYTRIRKAVFESETVVGVFKNEPQLVKNLVQEIVRLNQMKNPSLEVAEFKAKLETIFFSEMPDPAYIDRLGIDKREAVATFFSFIHFLIGVKPEYIYGLVEEALNADKLTIEGAESQSTDTIQNTKMDNVAEQDQESEPEININYFVEIKNKIQDDLSSGKIVDETEVFDLLQDYAEEYSDSRVLDLYYYDEQVEKFVWNDELLNEE
ncbi:MAG: hypothetical protein KBD29_01930 [Candidatus Magasanikbacteria bacterium]|nr:hypothetical protein [Candidatus Magasanikbacteria bacterium]